MLKQDDTAAAVASYCRLYHVRVAEMLQHAASLGEEHCNIVERSARGLMPRLVVPCVTDVYRQTATVFFKVVWNRRMQYFEASNNRFRGFNFTANGTLLP